MKLICMCSKKPVNKTSYAMKNFVVLNMKKAIDEEMSITLIEELQEEDYSWFLEGQDEVQG